MAGAMREVVAITGGANHAARRIIERCTRHGLLLSPTLFQ
jgi:hypothetical protein